MDALEAQLKPMVEVTSTLVIQKYGISLKKQRHEALKKNEKEKTYNRIKSSRGPSQLELDRLMDYYQKSQYDMVENFANSLTHRYPEHQFAWKALSVVYMQTGRLQEALIANQRAIELSPRDVEAHNNLGITLKKLGRLEDALASYSKVIALKPDSAEAHNDYGNILKELDRMEDALTSYKRAIAISPKFAEAHNNLGITLKNLGRLEDALASYSKAIAIKPEYVVAHNNLGNALQGLYRPEDALTSYRRAIAISPEFAEAHNNFGITLKNLGRLEDALLSYSKAIAIKPEFVEAQNNLGNALQELGRLEDALASYNKAIAIRPVWADPYNNKSITLQELGRFDDAAASCRKAIEIKPELAEAHNNLGNILKELGKLGDAVASFSKAIAIKPEFAQAHSNLLFTLNCVESLVETIAFEEATRYGLAVSSRANPKFTSWNVPTNQTKLRIGFVSGDLGNHPVGYFIEGLLRYLDPDQFEIIAFPTTPKSDELTARLKHLFQEWIPLYGKNDLNKATLIHQQAIQILIDLSGHTSHNQLPVFSFKPAPVAVSWLGYFATTGLPEIDYLLGDPYVTPVSEAHHFTEKLWQLPETYLCFTPPSEKIVVSSLPALHNGFITFGCFNNIAKMGDAVVRVWAAILQAIPNAALFLKTKQLNDAKLIAEVVSRFATHGIAPNRLVLEGSSPRTELLAAYNRVDIALDPFPYPGGTTSAEALWMGVPVLTLKGNRFLSHVGETIANNVGHPEWIASDWDNYVSKAVEFSKNLDYLSAIRHGLRNSVLQSSLIDSQRFAVHFGKAMQGIWQQYLHEAKE